ncbi:hypothetical protein FE257_009661 [Aspergillus nanangensis]|uniref:Beta-fructofuranosidase n=1 Tax=Aspergillus nanangensis TaxID=2582783 RepID=A0AAD4CK55_ASPNN|nr:hypothetical protein FE257_009661 [Aspergillus nanangensis]
MAVAKSADYSGDLRPQAHFSPPTNFMNDPNDNPDEPVAGNQHWGHATSRDLYHWDNHPIAISPTRPNEYVFSGSAVVDSQNTSGFFPDQDDGVVAIYTVDAPDAETQHIAYSRDGGYTFTKYDNNPVIDSISKDFRDPQVTWHAETGKWVLVVAYAADRVIGFYTSPNLRDWSHVSNFTQEGLPGTEFECPNLVKFSVDEGSIQEEKYVLFISVNPGAPLGGSGTFYVVGDFDGTHFHSEVQETLYDFSKDNYASQWYSGLPSDVAPISIGWASNWDYTEDVPTGPREGWRGSTTLARTHTLTKAKGSWAITQAPVNGLGPILDKCLTSQRLQSGEVSTSFSEVTSKAVYFEVTVSGIPSPNPSGHVGFKFTSSASGEYVDGGLFLETGRFWINRAGTRLFTREDNADYTSCFNTNVSVLEHGVFQFSGVFDRSVLEVFLNHGMQSGTMVFYPTAPLDTLVISVKDVSNETVVGLDVWGLKGTWR